MGGFLIDTMIWLYLFYPKKYHVQHANIIKRLDALPLSARISTSVITWGEISVGLPSDIQARQLKFIKALKPSMIGIDTHIAEEYGKIRGLLREKQLMNNRKKGLPLEKLVDHFTWLELGSLENDLWIAAQAISRNLILVTNDKLTRITEVAGSDLRIDNWAK